MTEGTLMQWESPSGSMTIRQLSEEDWPQVVEMLSALHMEHVVREPDRFTPVVPERLFEEFDPGGEQIGAFLDDSLIGVCVGFISESKVHTVDLMGCINDIYVAPQFRGCSVGARLMLVMLTLFKRRGVGGARLGVVAKNTEAIKFYERHGFVTTEYKMECIL